MESTAIEALGIKHNRFLDRIVSRTGSAVDFAQDPAQYGRMQRYWKGLVRMGDIAGLCTFWAGVWLYRVLLIALMGGIIGSLLTPVMKVLFFQQWTWLDLAGASFKIGFQYAGMWSLAVAFIWMVMDRKRIKQRAQGFFEEKITAHGDAL